jgi:hypothetical protein
MITTENSSIFHLLAKESMLLTSATFLIEKRSQKKFHHISKINLFPLSPIATRRYVADVNNIDSFASKWNMEEFSVVIMKRFRSNWFEKTEGRHVT